MAVTDSKGRFHPNFQLAHNADRMASKKPEAGGMRRPPMGGAGTAAGEHESIAHTTLHDHGDGTFHTEHEDGSVVEHPAIGHALMHMAAKHSDGLHFHAHHHPVDGIKSHQVGDDGHVEAHDHQNIEDLKDSMGRFLNEEEEEGGHSAYDAEDDGSMGI
jgi:hypothetical protein